jgi:HAD superfamily hydrolase (TIGR01509 family)
MWEAIIFDCDGVLIDSELIASRVSAEELTRLGFPLTIEECIQRFTGRPDREMRIEIEEEFGRPIPPSYDENVHARITEAYATELKILPGLKEALATITEPVCVASSSMPDKIRLGLESVGIYDRFAPNIVSASMVARGKPEPDVFIFAAGWLRVSPKRCLVIEDSVPGVRAAVRAGMTVLGFGGGSHFGPGDKARLLEAGAFQVIDSMDALPPVLRSPK